MAKPRRYDFHADEWLGGTLELSPYDRGIYITICALIYSRGERIEIELLRRHCGVHKRSLDAAVARLKAMQKIDVDDAYISQRRCTQEICNTRLRLQKWAENLPKTRKTNGIGAPPAHVRARQPTTTNHQSPSETLPPPLSPPVNGRGKKRLSPIEGIYQGFADALAAIDARDGGADKPPDGALLDGAGTGSGAPHDRRRLAG